MEANLNVNPNDDDNFKKFEGFLDRFIPIVAAIVITIIVYFIKK